jgi:NRAMP (natural resistance-associated macrophage protein)-like metal ion transporter
LKKKVDKFFRSLGPGIITAALILGPGTLTIASKLGSQFQYQLLWVILLSTIFMILFTTMSARYGFFQQKTLIQTIREKYGRPVSMFIGGCIFIISISFQSGNSIGTGLSLGSIFDTSPRSWILIFSLIAIITLFFKSFYKILEKIMIAMVSVMLLSFLFTVLISSPDWTGVLGGFIPKIPEGAEILVIAIVATSFSVAGAFYQSYLVQEKSRQEEGFASCARESISGIVMLGLISSLIIIAAGSVLYKNDISVNSVADMGKALEPLFGSASFVVFMIGLFAASFSSLIGNATLGGNILADTLNLGHSHASWSTRLLIMLLIVIGSSLAIAFSELRLKLIVFAQAFTILIVPVVAFVLLKTTNSKSIMGEHQNSMFIQVAGYLGVVFLTFLAIAYSYLIYFNN